MLVDLVEVAHLAGVARRQAEFAHERHTKASRNRPRRARNLSVSKARASASWLKVTSSSLSTTSRKLRRSSIARRAADCPTRYASSRDLPASTDASRTDWE